jgi:hypothetical protein
LSFAPQLLGNFTALPNYTPNFPRHAEVAIDSIIWTRSIGIITRISSLATSIFSIIRVPLSMIVAVPRPNHDLKAEIEHSAVQQHRIAQQIA